MCSFANKIREYVRECLLMNQRYLGGKHEVINNEQYTSNMYIRYLNKNENNESNNITMIKNQEYGGMEKKNKV